MYAEKVLTGSVIDYQEGYHRIQVISMVKDIIWVNFFDFGTVGVVRKDQLSLARNVQSFAQSGIECCLWGVEDRVGMARERLRGLVERGNMCGGVCGHREEDRYCG